MQSFSNMIISLPAIVIALTFHEYAHGRVAAWLGDDTPYYQGRLTINPLPHIDWVGFLMLLLFQFGWAKPVQINPLNFKNINIKKGMMLVALAGPMMNLLLALAGMAGLKLLGFSPYISSYSGNNVIWMQLIYPLVSINLILAAFNLIPVPPLDGSRVLAGLLPDSGTQVIYSLEQYGPILLLLLIVTGIAGKIFLPLATLLQNMLYALVF